MPFQANKEDVTFLKAKKHPRIALLHKAFLETDIFSGKSKGEPDDYITAAEKFIELSGITSRYYKFKNIEIAIDNNTSFKFKDGFPSKRRHLQMFDCFCQAVGHVLNGTEFEKPLNLNHVAWLARYTS